MDVTWITHIIFSALILSLTVNQATACPADIARRAQQCFTDLANGVSAGADTTNIHINDNAGSSDGGLGVGVGDSEEGGTAKQQVSGAMPLDYRKIREYCAEDGHMNRFVQCVESLLELCPHLPQEGALKQLINPQRVRTSVPNLCNNVDKVEAAAECMIREMNKRTACKDRAYTMVKSGMMQTASNITAMFNVQCRFFSLLAECQRKAVSTECGGNLGDLHADFLLSFVPNTCSDDPSDDSDLAGDQGQMKDLQQGDRHNRPNSDPEYEKPPEDLGQGKSQGLDQSDLVNDNVKTSGKSRIPALSRTASASRDEVPMQQVLQTLPPSTTAIITDVRPEVASPTPLSTEKPSSGRPSRIVIGSSAVGAPSHGAHLVIASFIVASVFPALVLGR